MKTITAIYLAGTLEYEVRNPFNAHHIIENTIPEHCRTWVATNKRWRIDASYIDPLRVSLALAGFSLHVVAAPEKETSKTG